MFELFLLFFLKNFLILYFKERESMNGGKGAGGREERERKREGERIPISLHARGARCGAQSHDPGIMA